MSKELVIVTGAENTGTRFITALLVRNGYYGNEGHKQELDNLNFKIHEPKMVIRRSVPHANIFLSGDEMDGIYDVVKAAREQECQVKMIVCTRDWNVLMKSHKNKGLVDPDISPLGRIQLAYASIFHIILKEQGLIDFVFCDYEAMCQNKYDYLVPLFRCLGINLTVISYFIIDGNRKYYQ